MISPMVLGDLIFRSFWGSGLGCGGSLARLRPFTPPLEDTLAVRLEGGSPKSEKAKVGRIARAGIARTWNNKPVSACGFRVGGYRATH